MENFYACEIQATYKKLFDGELVQVTQSTHIEKYLRAVWPVQIEYREAFVVAYLNKANEIVSHCVISTGGFDATIADTRMIFQHALMCSASAMILAHNHPAGTMRPSGNDMTLTKRLVECGKLMTIPVLDHIILTSNHFYSFADNGEL
jgi:DNA repair protein RadC